MQESQIQSLDKPVKVRVSGRKVVLPSALRTKINAFWRAQLKENPSLFNGEAFTATTVDDTGSATEVTLDETDYAHYLYSEKLGGLGAYTVRIIHSATLVETADGKIIFGSMGPQTSRPGVLQCSGGGIDYSDIGAAGMVDLDGNAARELLEELGLAAYDASRVAEFRPAYFKSGGPTSKMTVIYTAKLRETSEEFLQKYRSFVEQLRQNHEEPEFATLFCINTDPKAIKDFMRQHHEFLDEYMSVLLPAVTSRE